MREKIIIPKGLTKVVCIMTDTMYMSTRVNKYNKTHERQLDEYSVDERFTLGKVYDCRIGKTGKILIIRNDTGKEGVASYNYFKPFTIEGRTLKEKVVGSLINMLKKL